FLEFLFPQPEIENLLSPDVAAKGTAAALLGFAGLAVGRLFIPWRQKSNIAFFSASPRNIFVLFITATLIGYLHILLAVNFDPLEMIRQMSLPRFAQPWSRGKYGDASSLLAEIGALLYLIPPITGLIFAKRTEFGITQISIVSVIFFLTL